MLHLAVAVAEHHAEIAVALVREQVLLARVDVEGSLRDLRASVEKVELALIQAAAGVGGWVKKQTQQTGRSEGGTQQ